MAAYKCDVTRLEEEVRRLKEQLAAATQQQQQEGDAADAIQVDTLATVPPGPETDQNSLKCQG